jgi:hypothetical protein
MPKNLTTSDKQARKTVEKLSQIKDRASKGGDIADINRATLEYAGTFADNKAELFRHFGHSGKVRPAEYPGLAGIKKEG